jgi:cellulose synthase operon protein C
MLATAAKWSCAIAFAVSVVSTAHADEGDNLFAAAAAQYSAQQWEKASESFGNYLHEFPGHRSRAKALFFKAESLVQLGRYADAYPLFRDLLAEEPSGPLTRQATFRTAEAAAMSGRYNESQIYLAQFQAKYPTDKLNARVLLYTGSIAMKAGDLSGAERCYRLALERFPDDASADECRMALVHTLQVGKQTPAAEQVLHDVAKGNHSPWTETALLQLAAKEFATQKPQAALDYCAEIGKRFPESPMTPQAKLGRGRALYELKRFDEAHAVLAELTLGKEFAADARHWLVLVEKSQNELRIAAEEAQRKANAEKAKAEAKIASETPKTNANEPAKVAETKAVPTPAVQPVQPEQVAEGSVAKPLVAQLRNPAAKKTEPQFLVSDELAAQREEQNRRRSAAIRFQAADAMIRGGDFGRAIATLQIGDNSGDDPGSLTNRFLLAVALRAADRKAEAEQTLDELNTTLSAKLSGVTTQSNEAAAKQSAEDLQAYRELNERVQLAKATTLLASERFSDAIEPLRVFLSTCKVESKSDWAYANLARCLARTNRFDDARKALDDFKLARPQSELLRPALLDVAESAASAGQYAIAASLFVPLTGENIPAEIAAKSLVGLGWCQFRLGDHATAAETFGWFIDRYPTDAAAPDAALARGQSLEQQGKFEPALAVYRQSIIRYPKAKVLSQFLASTARLYDQLGQDDKAVPMYERLVREFPSSADFDATLYGYAWCLRDLGRGKESDKVFRQLYEQLPNSRFWADSTFRLAERAVHHGERAIAQTYLQQLLSIDCPPPVLQHTLYLQAQLAVSEQKWTSAEPPLKRLVEEFPDCSLRLPAEFWLAEVAYRSGDFAAAAQRFDTLMPRVTQHDEAWMAIVPLRRAQMLAEQKQWSAARSVAETIAHDFPQFDQQFEADYVIGRSLAAEGNFDGARAAFQRAVRSSAGGKTETAATAQYMIGDTYFRQQTYATALREFLKVESVHRYPRWQAAALRHAALCQEQLGHAKEAAELLARARQNYEEPEVLAERLNEPGKLIRK